MGAHLALLRAVNVGGTGKVSMAALADLFVDLGLQSPKTYLATGNVVFGFSGDIVGLAQSLHEKSSERLGLDTTYLIRSADEWRLAIDTNPFGEFAERSPSRMVLFSLDNKVDAGREEQLQASIKGAEKIRLAGRHLYACYPDGIGESKLTLPVIEKALGVPATGRNWNTARKLLTMLDNHNRR